MIEKHGDTALEAHAEAQRAKARALAWSGIEADPATAERAELRARVRRMIRDGVSVSEWVALTGLSAWTRERLLYSKRDDFSAQRLREIVSTLSARAHNAQAVSA